MQQAFDFVIEPRGETLHRLVRAVADLSSFVVLVLRDDLGLSQTGQTLLVSLEPHLLERTRSSAWPGTALLDNTATVLRFAASSDVIERVIDASDGLFGWQQPALPEDLAFVRGDESALLTTIAHEGDAFLDLTEEEHQFISRAIPELGTITSRRDQGRDQH